jgi:ribonuclease HII
MPVKVTISAPLTFEYQHWAQGHRLIAGLDEAGRGAWAGPVVAAVVVLPSENPDLSQLLHGVTDSKAMSASSREDAALRIRAVALGYAIGSASADEIDALNILNATKLAMRRALHALMDDFPRCVPDILFIDHLKLQDAPVACLQLAMSKFDSLSLTVAAASVLAKTWRDARMLEMDADYPGYGFASNKGYAGGSKHSQALETLGPCAEHRMTFKPVAQRRLL